MPALSRFVPAVLFLCVSALLVSCGSDDPPEPPPGAALIVVSNFEPAVVQGFTTQLHSYVVDSNSHIMRHPKIEWTALDSATLTVDSTGLLHSVGGLGSGRIRATCQGISLTLSIPVVERVGTFHVRQDSLVLNRNLYEDLEITLLDRTGAGYDGYGALNISSADTAIARLNGTRIEAGNISGQTVVTLAIDTFVVSLPVRVAQFPKSLSVTPAGFTLQAGASKTVTVTVLDRAGGEITAPAPTFVNETPTLVMVTPAGKITAKGPSGSATVRVFFDTLSVRIGVLVGTGRHFTLAHTTPIGSNAYEAATAPNGAMVVTTDSAGQVIRGTLPAFTFPAALTVGAGPRGVVLNHAGTRAYVAAGDELSVVDLSQNQVLPAIPVPGGGSKIAVEISPDDHTAYLSTADQLYRIDLVQGKVADSMPLRAALALAIHPTAPRLYASPLEGDSIQEIDLTTLTVVRTLHGGVSLKEIGLSPDGSELYAADEAAQLVVFNLGFGTEFQRVPLSTNGFGLAVSANLIAVATFDGVDLFDRRSRVLLQTVHLGGLPRRPAIGPNEAFIVVPNQGRWVDFIQ